MVSSLQNKSIKSTDIFCVPQRDPYLLGKISSTSDAVIIDILHSLSQTETNALTTVKPFICVEPVELIQSKREGHEDKNVDTEELHDII